MIQPRARQPRPRIRTLPFALCALVLLLLAGLPAALAATPTPHLNGAGLVIEHGDGSVLYFYVQFSEAEITGQELLERTGVQLDIAPFAGLGAGICMIDHEGCPSSNCFCKSYAVPSYFWRYHSLNASGQWVFRPSGSAQRIVHDGDVDGWSWSSDDGTLPVTTIDQIAQLNGVTRAHAAPTTITATPSPPGTPTTFIASPTAESRNATATPSVLGVEISNSGQATTLEPPTAQGDRSVRSYAWFGVALVMLLLAAGVAILRHRIRTAR